MNLGFGTPWQEQIDFLRQKLRLPTEKWDDIQRAAHDRAFMVAGAAKADLLADLHRAVLDAAEQGMGQAQFLRQFKEVVARNGWTGWTGEDSAAGQAWRARVIYQTNLAHSYAAGRWQQLKDPEFLHLRPYWRYIHSEAVRHPRPLHLAWHGLTLPHDHPFFLTHFAPNGWSCRCRIVAVSRKEGEASARAGLGQPPEGWDTIDPKTGAPLGIDKGFDYAPGATWHPNLDKYPYGVARQMVADNLQDGVFDRWHQRIADRVATTLMALEYEGLSKEAKTALLRKRLSPAEQYPIAVLAPDMAKRMGVSTQVVHLSEYDLIKQQVSRTGQDFGALDYLNAQVSLDSPRLVVLENEQMTLFVSDAAGRWYVAVLQQTATGKAVYLKSFRLSSLKDARLQRKKGTVLIDALPLQ